MEINTKRTHSEGKESDKKNEKRKMKKKVKVLTVVTEAIGSFVAGL